MPQQELFLELAQPDKNGVLRRANSSEFVDKLFYIRTIKLAGFGKKLINFG